MIPRIIEVEVPQPWTLELKSNSRSKPELARISDLFCLGPTQIRTNGGCRKIEIRRDRLIQCLSNHRLLFARRLSSCRPSSSSSLQICASWPRRSYRASPHV